MIAFVMSGGGSWGALEAGALLALFEAGIKPGILVGTSAGSINSAFIATDPTLAGANRLADLWKHMRQKDFFPGGSSAMLWRLAHGHSLFPSDGLRQSMDRYLPAGKRRFGDLQDVKLYITAANLTTGTLYLYGDQPDALLIDAVIASTAHPLLYPPVHFGNCQLVDGGVIANVPVGIAAEKGATEIYILSVGYGDKAAMGSGNLIEVLTRSILLMMYRHFLMDLRYVLENTDVILHHIPIKGFIDVPLWKLDHSVQMVEAGRKAVQDYLKAPQGLASVPTEVFGEPEEEMVPDGAQIYVPPCFHPGDILGLPQQQRQITAYLSRRGDSDPATMAQDLGRTLAQVRIDLASMAKKGYVQHLPDGKARLVFGHSRRSKLPNDILDALS